MENEATSLIQRPLAEQLVNPDESLEKRKKTLKRFFTGWVQDNYDKAFLLVLLIAFIIRIWIFTKTMDQALWYDAANYLAAAKKWGLGLEMREVWYYRRGFFWPAFSALFFMTGIGEIGIRFSVVLFSTGIVFVSYFLIKEMFNKKLALGVSICMTFSWVILFFTARPLTSIPATFFLLTALLFFWKGYTKKKGKKFLYLFGIFYGLAILTRMQYLMFVPVFLIFIFLREKFGMFKNKSLWITLIIFSLIMTPHVILYYQHYGNPVTDIAAHYFGVEIEGAASTHKKTFSTIFDYFLDLPYALSKPIFILFLIGLFYFFTDLIIGIDKIFKDKKIQKRLFVFLFLVIPLLVLGYITQYVEQRYYMQTLPFLFAIALIPLFKLKKALIKHKNIGGKTGIILIIISLTILLVYPNLNFFPNTKSNLKWGTELIESKKMSYYELKQGSEWIKQNSNPEDIVISPSEPQIAYYAERSTYTEGANATDLEAKVDELKPSFLLLYAAEGPQWLFQYPAEHQDILTPIHVIQQNEQPVLIIYKFNYPAESVEL